MAAKNYKIDEEIKFVYQAPGAESGLTVYMDILDELHGTRSDFPRVEMDELESTGRYIGSFTPDVKGEWVVTAVKADGSGKVVKQYSVGDYNVESLGTNIDAKTAGIGDKIEALNDIAVSDVEAENDKVRGADGDTLKTLSDQIDSLPASSPPMVG